MQWFNLSQQEVESTAPISFDDKETVDFFITKITEDQAFGGLKIETVIASQKYCGRNYPLTVRDTLTGKRTWLSIIKAALPSYEFGPINPAAIIGKTIRGTASKYVKEDKVFTNFQQFEPIVQLNQQAQTSVETAYQVVQQVFGQNVGVEAQYNPQLVQQQQPLQQQRPTGQLNPQGQWPSSHGPLQGQQGNSEIPF